VDPPRTRRTPEQARALILDAATALLAEGGVAAVQVRAVAARVGMTDAGVAHHFGTRENLLHELLRHGGRQMRVAVQGTLDRWLDGEADLLQLATSLADLYREGFSELAVALHAAGWRDRGSGMLDPLVEALHARRPDPDGTPIDDTRIAVAAFHQAIAMEPLYGEAFRRSVGFTAAAAADDGLALRWWAEQLAFVLGLDAATRRRRQGGRRDGA
jgi:AcrR family transcriptional regulator